LLHLLLKLLVLCMIKVTNIICSVQKKETMRKAAFMIAMVLCAVLLALPALAQDSNGDISKTAATRPVKVFIVAGQSNAVGYNRVKEYQKGRVEFPKAYRHQPNVLFWSADGEGKKTTWKALGIAASGAFGPEIAFAHDLAAELPEQRIAILKCASGGTGIARSVDYSDYIPALKDFNDHGKNWHPPADGKEAGLLYQKLIKSVRDGVSALDRQQIEWDLAGCLWMQGEHEAGISRKMAQDYDKLLAGFISAVRKDLKIPSLPFVIGQVNSHTWAYGETVRKMQAMVCERDPNAILVETIDLSRKGSGGASHFDADGMFTLGSRFAKAAASLMGKDKAEQSPGGDSLKAAPQE